MTSSTTRSASRSAGGHPVEVALVLVQQGGHHVRDAAEVVGGKVGVVGHEAAAGSVQTIVACRTVPVVRVSTRGDYASRALLSLALHADESGPTSVRDIAERTGLPQPYLEQILLALKGAGIVRSKRGVGGGYILAREPSLITLGEIVSAVDGPITLGDFGEPHQDGACDHEGQCVLLAVWAGHQQPHPPPARQLHAGRHRRHGPRPGRLATSPRPSPGSAEARRAPRRGRRAAATRTPAASPVTGWASSSALGVQERPRHRERLALAAVARVAHHRVADRAKVDADLVRAPGLEGAHQLGDLDGLGEPLPHLVRACGPPCPARRRPSAWARATDRPIGASIRPRGASTWPHTSARYWRCTSRAASAATSAGVRLAGPGHEQEPGRALVEPVDDAGPLGVVADAADLRVPGQQPLHQRAGALAGSRVHHQAGRLVDHEQVLVLVDDGHDDVGIALESAARRDVRARPPRARRRRARGRSGS